MADGSARFLLKTIDPNILKGAYHGARPRSDSSVLRPGTQHSLVCAATQAVRFRTGTRIPGSAAEFLLPLLYVAITFVAITLRVM